MNFYLRNRHEEIHNNIFITHLAFMLILLAAIFKNLNLTAVDAHVFIKYFLFFSLLFLVECTLVYILKSDRLHNKKRINSFLLNSIFVTFPLAASVFVLFLIKNILMM